GRNWARSTSGAASRRGACASSSPATRSSGCSRRPPPRSARPSRRRSPAPVARFWATRPIAGAVLSCETLRMADNGIVPDWQREARIGVGEAVYCGGKTAEQILRILALADERKHSLLLTKLDPTRFAELGAGAERRLDFDPLSQTAVLDHGLPPPVPS